MTNEHLGPRLATKPLHLYWLLDTSGSMGVDGKMDALNEAMRVSIEAVRQTASETPGVQVLAGVITFAHDAEWLTPEPIAIEQLEWNDVPAVDRGTTELGRAIELATTSIRRAAESGRGLPPALVLVSDGKPTDLKVPSFGESLRRLAATPWGAKASRVAIGIGRDADMDALNRFVGHDELPALRASDAAELTHYLRWASTVVLDEGSWPVAPWSDPTGPAVASAPPVPSAAAPPADPPTALTDPVVVDPPTVVTAPPPTVDPPTVVTAPPTVDPDDQATVLPDAAPPSASPRPPAAPPSGPARRHLPPPPEVDSSQEGDVW